MIGSAQLREEEDLKEPNLKVNLVTLFPIASAREPRILATSLPVDRLWQVRAVVKLYEYRWVIETTFETMKGELHLDEFMVRKWVTNERLLWAGAMAYTLLWSFCGCKPVRRASFSSGGDVASAATGCDGQKIDSGETAGGHCL